MRATILILEWTWSYWNKFKDLQYKDTSKLCVAKNPNEQGSLVSDPTIPKKFDLCMADTNFYIFMQQQMHEK